MKKIPALFILFLFFIVVSTSCKKNSASNGKYYVTFKVNDTFIKWTNHIFVDISPDLADTSQINLDFNSTSNNMDTAFFIDLTIGGKTIPAATYTYSYNFNDTVLYTDYNLGNNDPTKPDFDIEDVGGMPAPTFVLTITSITSTEVKGTFTGNYLASYASGPPVTLSITDGEFYAPIVHF
ncbi:MAG TPA: hypothetical protein VK787_09770 [Puia sp.]|jgi:hypothetical protein|nr:hypothetical protein [Puia sp.]